MVFNKHIWLKKNPFSEIFDTFQGTKKADEWAIFGWRQ